MKRGRYRTRHPACRAGGLLTGSADGALGAGAAALSAPHLEALGNRLGGTGKAAVDTLGGAAIGCLLA